MPELVCQSCTNLSKQLKVQKADYEFQIKKIKEDKSTEKALYQVHLQKQIRKWQQQYQKEKTGREQENYNWICKYDMTVEQYEGTLKQLRQQHEKMMKLTSEALIKQHTDKYNRKTSEYEEVLQKLREQHTEQITKMQKSTIDKIFLLQSSHEKHLGDLRKAHERKMEQLKTMLESNIIGLKSQLNKEEQLHKNTQKESKQAQQKMYQQLFSLRRKISDLQSAVEEKQRIIQEKNQIIDLKDRQTHELTAKYDHQKSELQESQRQQLCIQKQNYLALIKNNKEAETKFYQEYQTAIKRIQEARAVQRQIYADNIQQLELNLETRLSRPEDLIEIEKLNEKLTKKTKEFELLTEELKWCRLQLQNKQQTYNKIFVPFVPNNGKDENSMVVKKKQFKLRRQGRSVTTVREILQSMNSNNSHGHISVEQKKTLLIPKPKVL